MNTVNASSNEDMQFVRACKEGDREAFNHLILKYQDRIFNTLMRLVGEHELASDLTQETFLHAYKGLPKFQEASSFFTWLFRIAINQATSARRKQGRRKKFIFFSGYSQDEERSWEPSSVEEEPLQNIEQKECKEYVQQAISTLEEPFKTALILRDIEGLSYEEIQEVLECPEGTVRSRIHRARLIMKEKLQKYL